MVYRKTIKVTPRGAVYPRKGANIMNNKTVTLTATERSYLIIELQMNLNDLMQKYKKADKSGDEAAYYILSDARFIADLLNKIKGEDE